VAHVINYGRQAITVNHAVILRRFLTDQDVLVNPKVITDRIVTSGKVHRDVVKLRSPTVICCASTTMFQQGVLSAGF
jgi:hypothetical protein